MQYFLLHIILYSFIRNISMPHMVRKLEDTKIEIKLRIALWYVRIRYRKNYKALLGKLDIVITRHRIVVFCDSEFWHGRNYENGQKPKNMIQSVFAQAAFCLRICNCQTTVSSVVLSIIKVKISLKIL